MSERVRWSRVLPYALLLLASVIATAAVPVLGDSAASLDVTWALAALTALWMLLTPQPSALHWVGRTVLAFALCWLNPLYGIFACVGFIDAYDVLRGRWTYVGIAAVAVTLAGSQSGGLPPQSASQAILLGALLVLNVGLALMFLRSSEQVEARAVELQELNIQLTRAVAENESLQQQLLEQARASGVQEERARLAREIHDTIAQNLAGVVTQLEAALGPGLDAERHAMVLELAREALVDTRRSVLDLAPQDLDGAALPQALSSVVEAWSDERRAGATMVVVGTPVPLHQEVEATVVRVAQESLANVAKHAGRPGRVGVTLSYDEDEVVLDVRDDGDGFDPSTPSPPDSFGLRGMRQRAERLAGTLVVESRPGEGTAVSVRLPSLTRESV